MYDFEIKYQKGSDMKQANGFSRLPLNVLTDIEPDSLNNICFSSLSLKLDGIALEMQNYRILTEVYRAILDEWPKEIALARSYIWWPGIDQDMKLFVSSCKVCQTCQRENKPILTSWKEAKYPFERIDVEFSRFLIKHY